MAAIKEQTTDTCKNMDASGKHYGEFKSQAQRLHSV